jgi:hypothetical protein
MTMNWLEDMDRTGPARDLANAITFVLSPAAS